MRVRQSHACPWFIRNQVCIQFRSQHCSYLSCSSSLIGLGLRFRSQCCGYGIRFRSQRCSCIPPGCISLYSSRIIGLSSSFGFTESELLNPDGARDYG